MNRTRSTIVISPDGGSPFDWRELYAFRELFLAITWRDISVRYKQTFAGFAWVIVKPLLTILTFTIVFGGLAKVPSIGDIPYALVVCTGLLPWYLMSLSVNDAAGSLVGNAPIITKVYFPRLILPMSTLLVNLVDFIVSLAILAVLAVWYGIVPSWQIVLLPLWIVLALMVTLGPGLLFAALNVEYRDFRFIVPFMVQIGLFISPVAYSISIVPDKWKLIYSINPAVGVIESFRWCFFGEKSPLYWPAVAISLGFALAVMWMGVVIFRNAEKKFADVI